MKLIYGVKDRPKAGQLILFALQQLLAILAATIAVPMVINNTTGSDMSISAALFGAGAGTLVYLLFTKFKSPVFLGSSFAFIGSMTAAFAGGVSAALGYLGLIIGAVFAGLVYVLIAVVVKFVGVKWIDKLMPAAVIGPTVAIIGLSLSTNAISDLMKGDVLNAAGAMACSPYLALVCGLVAFGVTVACSVYGKKMARMIPFIIGILAGYALAAIFTVIGNAAGVDALKIIDFSIFKSMEWYPRFTFLEVFDGSLTPAEGSSIGAYIGTIAVAYIPVAFVVFAEHIADHKNISSIIETDLLTDPGLSRTLLGDGVGSMVGAVFGGCPNTTYGESVGCVAISGNASVSTTFLTAIFAIVCAFVGPFTSFLDTIPSCVMGGVCMCLYGFIAVSGLKMVQKVDLEDNGNLFTVSAILVAGIGGLTLTFGGITITSIACALILGILTNVLVNAWKKNRGTKEPAAQESAPENGVAQESAPESGAAQDQTPPPAQEAAEPEPVSGGAEDKEEGNDRS